MNNLLTDRVKLIRALQACVKLHYLYHRDERTLVEAITRIRNDHDSFLSLSQDRDGRVSYSSKPENKFNNKRRVRTSLGRYFRRQLGIGCDSVYGKAGITDKNIAWIQSQIFAHTADISGSVVLVCGEEIRKVYDSGFGGYTCMSGEDYGKYTQLYADNPDVVAMIKFDNGAQARALLWTTDDGVKVLDRIYPDDGGAHIVAIRLWAEKQGYIIRGYNHLPEGDSIPLSDDGQRRVTLRDCGIYPYLDTFCFGTIEDGHVCLSNVRKDGDHIFQGTDGKWLDGLTCCACDEDVSEDRVCTHSGDSYCEDCFSERFTYCDCCNAYYEADSVICCQEDSRNYCELCTESELFYCHGCNDWYATKIIAADTENKYCESCAADTLTLCEDCGDFYEKPLEEIRKCLCCPDCAANLKQKDLFKGRRKSRKAAVAV